jgi:hypothetical protein
VLGVHPGGGMEDALAMVVYHELRVMQVHACRKRVLAYRPSYSSWDNNRVVTRGGFG